MLSERTIINGLILLAGMILGPYLISLTFELNQLALLSFAAFVFLFGGFFFIKDRISLFPFIASFFSGNLNFLPFGLTPDEIFSLMIILYYLVNHLALKRRPLQGGPRYFLFPMVIVGGIVLYHDHQLSLGALGGSQEGSRPGLLILLAVAAYLCAINIPCPSDKFISRVPIWCFLASFIGSSPMLVTTYFPALSPYVYFVFGNINMDAYILSLSGGDASDLTRNGSLLTISSSLEGILVAYFPISTWWRPSRWIFIILSLFSMYGILTGGYRNSFLSFIMVFLLGAICYSRWRVLLMLPLFCLAPLALIFVQSNHFENIHLPTTVQRTMSFLPGQWDPEVMDSAESSNDFRDQIKKVYIKEYLGKSPWIGNGFSFDAGEADEFDRLSHVQKSGDATSYYETKAFLTSKNFHVGWISLYDAVGIIGSIAFIMLDLSMISLMVYFVFRKDADMKSPFYPLKVWLFCGQFASLVGYFTTFGSFSQSFVGFCNTAVLLVYLNQIEQRNTLKTVSLSPQISLSPLNTLTMTSPARIPLK
jgi:hypothetical protein